MSFVTARGTDELTRREAEVLGAMAALNEELVYEHGRAIVGCSVVARWIVFDLLRRMLISPAQDSDVGSFERYFINGRGREALADHWGIDLPEDQGGNE